jgi:hypothetical protein
MEALCAIPPFGPLICAAKRLAAEPPEVPHEKPVDDGSKKPVDVPLIEVKMIIDGVEHSLKTAPDFIHEIYTLLEKSIQNK